ncbi:MAG: hypothetical protein HN793_05090 [Rhodospirillaceae bacterium]|jgi:hypothetical protein|nr:hypothetical protein [Rhodospirillaceae bacterium]MBT5242488.1 hypothetical protein [Rhodospirillaceae bacterium]MBT5566443.1 hypothetical protein [Rhodospirillaceae bacterium]MBT6088287.1 hypothetical protein [Rhodospirillaceae bacterium]MBT6960980.1 hypothetical protein [Rhodospirillaceae bacterium]
MLNRALFIASLVAASPALLLSAYPASAISDDANPWLAIESALCVAHRTVDYSALVGVPVSIETAEWTGAQNSLPTHCHVAGTVDGEVFDFKLPMTWNGAVSPGGCESPDPDDALNDGMATAFGPITSHAYALLSVIVAQHYDATPTSQPVTDCR